MASLLDTQNESIQALQSDVNAHTAARFMSIDDFETQLSAPNSKTTSPSTMTPKSPFESDDMDDDHVVHHSQKPNQGTRQLNTYHPNRILAAPPKPEQLTLPLLLANQTHLGHATSLWNPANSSYIYGARDGIHIISLDITYAYLKRAAKVVQEVTRRGGIVLYVATRRGMKDIIVNAAKMASGYHIFDRWVPGSLTNGQQILGHCPVQVVDMHDKRIESYNPLMAQRAHTAMRPDLVVCMNPIENEVLLHECGLFSIPTVGIIDTDANPAWVTYPIPANDDSLRSVALIAGTLGQAGKEGQRQRGLAADKGKTTYDTQHLTATLSSFSEISEMVVGDNSTQRDKDS